MSAGEIPEFYTQHADESEVFMDSYEVDLAEKLYLLKVVLENDRSADTIKHAFTFCGKDLDTVCLPPSIRNIEAQHGVLTSMIVVSAHYKDYDKTNFEMHLEFRNAKGGVSSLVVERPYSSTPTPKQVDELIVNAQLGTEAVHRSVNPLTAEQFNRCIGSLVYGNPNIDPTIFDNYDWHSEAFMVTTDMLRHAADTTWSEHKYFLTDEDSMLPVEFDYFYKDGDVTEMRLARTTQHDIVISDDSNLEFSEKTTTLSLSTAKSTTVELLESTTVHGCSNTQQCILTQADYQTTFELIDNQIDRIRRVQLKQFEDDTVQPPEN